MKLLVRVKRGCSGYYRYLREAGQKFVINYPWDFGSWMEPIGWKPVREKRVKKANDGKTDVEYYVIVGAEPAEVVEEKAPSPDRTGEIRAALEALDHANPDHWTGAGLPAMKVIEDAIGDSTIRREDVEDAFPGFRRDESRSLAP